jgi:hypothetical protein
VTQPRANTQKSHLVQLRSREIGYASSTIGRTCGAATAWGSRGMAMALKVSTGGASCRYHSRARILALPIHYRRGESNLVGKRELIWYERADRVR